MNRKQKLDNLITQLIFTGPTIFIFMSVIVVSFIFGVYLTVTDWDGISKTIHFVGAGNYIRVISDDKFWTSILLTVKYVLFAVITVNVMAFTFAYLLTSGMKGQNLIRSGFFTPNLIGGIVLGMMWKVIFLYILVPIGENFNISLLQKSWLGDENLAFWALVVGYVWQYAGYMMLIYIAGFMNVPKELLEASSIDGANGFVKMKRVILPLMIPSFVICLFLSVQRGFMVYDVNRALTDGGPYKSTELISYHVYQRAFLERDYGGGQAAAFFLFLLVVIVTVSQTYFMKKLEVES